MSEYNAEDIRSMALDLGMNVKEIIDETGFSKSKIYKELEDLKKLPKASSNGYGGINLSIPEDTLQEALDDAHEDLEKPFYIDSHGKDGKIVLELYDQKFVEPKEQ